MANRAVSSSPRIFNYFYKANPGPSNCATHHLIRSTLDTILHPFRPRTQKLIDNFDPCRLYILVTCGKTLCKSRYVREHAARRLRSLLSEALRDRGWNWNGTRREVAQIGCTEASMVQLKGAYALYVTDLPAALNAKADEVRARCRELVYKMEQNSRSELHSQPAKDMRKSKEWRMKHGDQLQKLE